MKKNVFLGLTICVLLFLSNGCSSDEEGTENDSYIEFTIGEDTWVPTEYTSTLTSISSLNGHRYDISASNEDYKIFLAVAEESTADCITEKTYTATGDNLDEVLLFFFFELNGSFFSLHSDQPFDENEESDVIVTITSCSGDKISGTFSGTFYSESEIPDNVVPQEVVISGEFENLSFLRQAL